jgi:hypothetical protein
MMLPDTPLERKLDISFFFFPSRLFETDLHCNSTIQNNCRPSKNVIVSRNLKCKLFKIRPTICRTFHTLSLLLVRTFSHGLGRESFRLADTSRRQHLPHLFPVVSNAHNAGFSSSRRRPLIPHQATVVRKFSRKRQTFSDGTECTTYFIEKPPIGYPHLGAAQIQFFARSVTARLAAFRGSDHNARAVKPSFQIAKSRVDPWFE